MKKWVILGGTCAFFTIPIVMPVVSWLPWVFIAVKAYPLVTLALQAPQKTWYENAWDTATTAITPLWDTLLQTTRHVPWYLRW